MHTTAVVAIVIVGLTAALSLSGMFVVRRCVAREKLEQLHEVAGNMLAVVGTMYALLVALIVVDAMSNMQEARATTELEANSLSDIFRLANSMPGKHGLEIQKQCFSYGRAVVDDEWDKMAESKESDLAWQEFSELWHVVERVEPQTEQQKTFYAQMTSELSSLGDSRRSRLLASHHGISQLLWSVLFLGAAVTIGFTYFFAVESWIAQAVMIVFVSTTIALNLFLINEYAYAFQGSLRVPPDAFTVDLSHFSKRLGAPPMCGPGESPK